DQGDYRAPRRRRIGPLCRALLPFLGVAGEHADDVVDAADDAAGDVVGAKARDDRVLDDELGDGVGERALEAVATSMRTLRSLGSTIGSTPLFLPCCPILQRRPSSTPKSSIEVPCNDRSVTTTSWSVVLASRSASFWVSAARVARSRILASS